MKLVSISPRKPGAQHRNLEGRDGSLRLRTLDGLRSLRRLELTRTDHLKQRHLDAFRQRNPHCQIIGATTP